MLNANLHIPRRKIKMDNVTYAEGLAWLLGRTDLERQPMARTTREQMSLARPAALLEWLGNPPRNYRTILVAGSKGKGSTAVMLASILQAAGHRTGFYSQPHLHSYRERIRINGAPISQADFAVAIARLRTQVQGLDHERPELGQATTFEITTALALDYFARAEVDVAVVEVGLGGRLDATNVIDAGLSLITPISYEHMAVLGNTLAEIAFEKAGIIKPGRPVLSAPQPPEAGEVLRRVASERRAPYAAGGRDWTWRGRNEEFQVTAAGVHEGLWSSAWDYEHLRIALRGTHQLENAATAVAAAQVLGERYALAMNPAAISEGLAAVRWPGRIEVVRERPTIIVDGAHNGDSAEKLAAVLRDDFRAPRVWLIFGVLADKDLAAIIAPLAPMVERAWTVQTRHPRSRPAEEAAAALKAFDITAVPAASTANAISQALAAASPGDLICITGSLSTAAEAREALGLVPEVECDG